MFDFIEERVNGGGGCFLITIVTDRDICPISFAIVLIYDLEGEVGFLMFLMST